MNSPLHQGSLELFTVMGIPVRVHFSWLIIFGLITWSLSSFYFPKAAPELPALSYWVGGSVAAFLLFVSVAFHELAHSFIARRYRISIASITIFIFGGVAQMKGEPPSPQAEFRIALAGPLSSFFLSLLFSLMYFLVKGPVAGALFSYLTQLNFVLGLFNLIPGFPMDGGRVVRAYLWKKTGDFFSSTLRASGYGQKIAIVLVVFGLISIISGMPGGLWLMLIGWFLLSAAHASYQQATLQETLGSSKVRDIMVRDLITVSPEISVDALVNDYFLHYGYGGFPVVDNGQFLGFVTLKEVKNLPREGWKNARVSEIYARHNKRWEVAEDDNALNALERMISEDTGRLIVTRDSTLVGLITRNGIARYVQIMGREGKE